jgi:hypothetical protein
MARVRDTRDGAGAVRRLFTPLTGRPDEHTHDGPATLSIDRRLHQVDIDGRPVNLRPKEYELLTYLAGREGVFVPREQILADVWDDPGAIYLNSLHVHVSRLRMKLGESSTEPRFVHTSRLGGVMLLTEWPPDPARRTLGATRAGPRQRSLHDGPPHERRLDPLAGVPALDGVGRLPRTPSKADGAGPAPSPP